MMLLVMTFWLVLVVCAAYSYMVMPLHHRTMFIARSLIYW